MESCCSSLIFKMSTCKTLNSMSSERFWILFLVSDYANREATCKWAHLLNVDSIQFLLNEHHHLFNGSVHFLFKIKDNVQKFGIVTKILCIILTNKNDCRSNLSILHINIIKVKISCHLTFVFPYKLHHCE